MQLVHFFPQSIFLIYCHPHVIMPLLFLLVRRTRSQETQQTSGRSFKTGEKSVRRNNERVIVCGLHLQHHSLFGSCLLCTCCHFDLQQRRWHGFSASCFWLLLLEITTADHQSPSHPIPSILCHLCMPSFYIHKSSRGSPSFPPACQFDNHLPFPIYPRFILYSSKNNLSLIDLVSRLPNLMSLWCPHFWIQEHIFRL